MVRLLGVGLEPADLRPMIAVGSGLCRPALISSVAMQSVVACFPRDVGFPEACFKVNSP